MAGSEGITKDRRWAKINNLLKIAYGYGKGPAKVHGLIHFKPKKTETGFKIIPLSEAWRIVKDEEFPEINSSAFDKTKMIIDQMEHLIKVQDELIKELFEYCKMLGDGVEESEETDPLKDEIELLKQDLMELKSNFKEVSKKQSVVEETGQEEVKDNLQVAKTNNQKISDESKKSKWRV